MILVKVLLFVSIGLQLTGTILVLRLVRITRHYTAWVALAAAIGLMALRRGISLYTLWLNESTTHVNLTAEVTAGVVSLLIVIAMIKIRPVVENLYKALDDLESTNKWLKREIKNRKKAESLASANEEKFRKLADHSPILIWMSDQQGACTYFNERWLQFRGRTHEQEEGMGWTHGVHPGDKNRIIEKYLDAFKKRQPFDLEYRLMHASGEYRWIYDRGTPMYRDNGEFLGYIGSCIDITNRVQALEALRHSERKFRKIVNSLPQFVAFVDKDYHYRLINNKYLEYFGVRAKDILGKHLKEIIGPDSFEKVQPQLEQAMAGKQVHYHQHFIYPNGREADMEGALIPEFDSQGEVSGYYAILSDISHHVHNQHLLEESRNRMRILSEHQQNLLEKERSYIAREIHDELGQNLTAISMGLAMMKKHISGDQRKLRLKIKEINQIADTTLSAIKKLSAELRPQLIDDMGLVAAMEWYVHQFEKRSGITCSLELTEQEITFPQEMAINLYRILQEALTNVYKHAHASAVSISLNYSDSMVHLRIKDDGRGLAQEDKEKAHSYGIMGMEERVRLLNGQFTINGTGGGTMIQIEVPFH